MAKFKHWSKEELEFLKREYATADNEEIAYSLGRTVRSVESMAYKLGIRKTKLETAIKVDIVTDEKKRVLDEIDRIKNLKRTTSEDFKTCTCCGEVKKGSEFSFVMRDEARLSQCTKCRKRNSNENKTNRIIEGRDW